MDRASRSATSAQHQLEPVGVDQVGLGDDGNAGRDAQVLEHREVLERLRHDPLVRGDDQQREVDARGPATMVRTKSSWPGTSTTPAVRPSPSGSGAKLRSIVMPAPPLLREAVHGLAGERRDQRRLPVVDVTRGADDHAGTQGRRSQKSSAGSSAPSARW